MGTYRIILNQILKKRQKNFSRKKEDESSIKSRLNKRQALEATKNSNSIAEIIQMFQRLITEVQQVKFQYFGKKGISNGLRLFTYPNSPKSPKCTFLNWESWGRQKAKWFFTYPNSLKFTFFNFILGVGKKPSGFLPTPTLPNSLFSISYYLELQYQLL